VAARAEGVARAFARRSVPERLRDARPWRAYKIIPHHVQSTIDVIRPKHRHHPFHKREPREQRAEPRTS
jgi:hypothetical protein